MELEDPLLLVAAFALLAFVFLLVALPFAKVALHVACFDA